MSEHNRFFNPSDINWSETMAGQTGAQPFFAGLLKPFQRGGNPASGTPNGTEPAGGMGVQPGQGGGNNAPGSTMQPGGGQPNQGGNQGMNGNGNPSGSNFVLPGGGNQPGAGGNGNQPGGTGAGGNTSPLDKFSNLWNNANVDKDGKPVTQVDPFTQPLLNADPDKIAQAAGSHDFLKSVPPELMQKAMGGDFQAMAQLINHVGQQSLSVAAQLSTATAEHAGRGVQSRFDQVFEDRFRKQQLRQTQSTNPVLQHPNAAPMLEMLRERAATNNPSWSAQQAAAWAENYLMEMAGELRPGSSGGQGGEGGENSAQRPGQVNDWDEWAGM